MHLYLHILNIYPKKDIKQASPVFSFTLSLRNLIIIYIFTVTIAHTVRYIEILFTWAVTKVMDFQTSDWTSFLNAMNSMYKRLKRHDRKVKVKNGDYDTDVLEKRKEWPEGGLLQLQQCVRTQAPPLIEHVSTRFE